MKHEYDLVILGGGPGGYVAAIRASQLGFKVAVVEKEKLGGTCLHKGCIPSKALLKSAEVFREAKRATEFGIDINAPVLRFEKVQERKTAIVNKLYQGVQSLMKKWQIDVFQGTGRILGSSIFSPIPSTISVEHDAAEQKENTMLQAKFILLATGSKPKALPGLPWNPPYILSSDEALSMEKLPKSIIIVGGGVIGIEWASMLTDFGVNVCVIEQGKHILPTEDTEIARQVAMSLQKRGVKLLTNAKLLTDKVHIKAGQVVATVEQQGEQEILTADNMMVAIGREANVSDLGLQNTAIKLDRGYIQTNACYQTEESHIYAIGDVIGGLQLAHVASYEGITAVEHMADQDPLLLTERQIPACVYSYPEVAKIGLTEQQAREQGYQIKTGKFSFQANGKALIEGHQDGFVKIIADEKTDDILGIHMVGPHVTNLISEGSLATLLDATPWEISQAIHPHPTLSEVTWEAALAVDNLQLHG